jgi:hypothetical protein
MIDLIGDGWDYLKFFWRIAILFWNGNSSQAQYALRAFLASHLLRLICLIITYVCFLALIKCFLGLIKSVIIKVVSMLGNLEHDDDPLEQELLRRPQCSGGVPRPRYVRFLALINSVIVKVLSMVGNGIHIVYTETGPAMGAARSKWQILVLIAVVSTALFLGLAWDYYKSWI